MLNDQSMVVCQLTPLEFVGKLPFNDVKRGSVIKAIGFLGQEKSSASVIADSGVLTTLNDF